MTDRQKKLLKDYGPIVMERCKTILDQLQYLPADALACMTDEEWKSCAETMVPFENELYKVRNLVFERLEEINNDD